MLNRNFNPAGKLPACLLLFLLGFVFSLPGSVYGSGARVVRVGFYENPPKLYYGAEQMEKGIFPDIIELIASRENWQIEWVPGTWKEGLARLESGSIDIMPDVAYSVERGKKYAFTDEPVFINWGTLYTRAGIHVASFPDLRDMRIAVMRGSIHTDGREGIKNQLKKFNVPCTFIEFNNYQDVFQALQNNLADVGVVNRLFGTTSQGLYDVLPTAIAFNPRHLKFAFPLDGQQTAYLKKSIDHYLKAAQPDPDSIINHIIQSYLCGIPLSERDNRKQIYLTDAEKAWLKAHPVIRVGIDSEFAPFEFIDNTGRYSGYASDYLNLLRQRLGLNLEIITDLSWSQVMSRAEQGTIDLLPAVGSSAKRAKFLSYTTPYIGFHRMIFSRTETGFIFDINDVAQLKIAVQANSSHAAWLTEHTNLKADQYNSLAETIRAVSTGKADILIGNLAACSYWIRKLNITNLQAAVPVSPERQLLYMAVRKDWPELVGILNKGLASISSHETETIRNRWSAAGFTVGIPSVVVWRRIGIVALLALLAIVFFWQWNRRLQKRISERTSELEENKNYLQSIFNAPNEAIFIHDSADGSLLDVNETMLEMYQLTYEEALHVRLSQCSANVPPYTQKEINEKIALAIKEGPQTFEWLAKRKDGTLFWVEVGLKLTESDNRSYIIAVVRNIDEKKKAEQILAEEQERLAVTLRSIADGVITTDIEGRIFLLNSAAEQLTGWSQEEAQGMASSEVFNIRCDKTGEKCNSPIEHILQSGQAATTPSQVILTTKNGQERIIADKGSPIRDKESNIIGVVLVFSDVTAEKKMEAEMLKIKKLESIGILAGGIAHDFNNILSAILGNIELASLVVKDNPEASSLLVDARKATTRAAKLTQQLLTFAKGGAPIKETASLPQLIQDSAKFVLHGSPVSCHCDFPADLSLVSVDTGQIGQVIQNMILNARHAMPEGGIIDIRCANISKAEIGVLATGPVNDFVEISIRDTGIGISPEVIDKIFDPYFSGKEDGNGLGLAICYSIINKHGGCITVKSAQGAGTTFFIYLPASESNEPAEIKFEKAEEAILSSAKILVMDDEEMFRNTAKAQLRHLGHDVVLAVDGEQAVRQYSDLHHTDKSIDIVIMDLTIPGGMGGREAVQKILEIDPQARVIVASGYSTDPIMANHQQYGFCASIPKPFNLEILKKTVLSVLSQHKK
jgi:PAS domain S-box-containing protein